MKLYLRLFCLLCAAVVLPSVADEPVLLKELTEREGVSYLGAATIPFSGQAVQYYENGQRALQVSFRQGLRHGRETAWYQDGEPKHRLRYAMGQPQSLGSAWYSRPKADSAAMSAFLSCGLTKKTAATGTCPGGRHDGPSSMRFCMNGDC